VGMAVPSMVPAAANRSQVSKEAIVPGHRGKLELWPWQRPLLAPRNSPKLTIGDAIEKAKVWHVSPQANLSSSSKLRGDQVLR
jgi:hypothetical protein